MRKNKNTSKIILAIIVAGLATMISYTAFSKMHKELAGKEQLIQLMQTSKMETPASNFTYAVATKDLKAGEIVADEDIDYKSFPQINTNAYDNRAEIVNKILLQDIASDETFTSSHIAKISNDSSNVELKAGYRSLTIPADRFQGKSSKMIAGSRIDIISASAESNWALNNIKILALESSTPLVPATSITNASLIDFEVPANCVADFISNLSKGQLVLIARNPNDKQVAHKTYSAANRGPSSMGSMGSLPNLPSTVPISNLPGGELSGLPYPIKPSAPAQEVEMIEANVKSKITFD